MSTPSGVVAILTRGNGEVMATAADFDPKSPGYGTVDSAQKGRARQALANTFVREWCGADIAEVMRGYDAEQLVDALCQRKGYQVTMIAAGGDPSPAATEEG
ncbi:hypothetical protein [Methylobacterium sp. P1-11]|uniref:hypothetical protein n=1 Tax=Methylobacterium sp. P1-11 TaxID=2024616 RepID=UPI0011EE1F84|nr:hypothetical protein [Methylobacterium sp. P1-11]